MSSLKTLSALAAATALALPAAAAAQSPKSVEVIGRAPTEVRVPLVGKAVSQVRQEIRVAASTVCRNAVANRELPLYDRNWCFRATRYSALKDYAMILRHNQALAESGEIRIALR
jgi:hypothetical protein